VSGGKCNVFIERMRPFLVKLYTKIHLLPIYGKSFDLYIIWKEGSTFYVFLHG